MSSNYPPGVTGNEYAIAGPDYEKESNKPCPQCGEENVLEQGYQEQRWLYCQDCQVEIAIESPEPDPDVARELECERLCDQQHLDDA